jgi:hypothetical protein
MPEIRFFEVPETMKILSCEVCGLPDCDVLVQEYIMGGAYAVFHEPCLDEIIQVADALEDEDEDELPN